MAHKARKKNIFYSIPSHSGMQEIPKNEEFIDENAGTEESASDSKEHKQWWNNGEKNVLSVDCPEGYTRGKLKK